MEAPGGLEAIYRRARPSLMAAVTRLLGPAHLDQVEAAVQEAFIAPCGPGPRRRPAAPTAG